MASTKKTAAPPTKSRGRPPGTGQGRNVGKVGLTLPLDLLEWLDAQPNKSAAVAEALRAHIARLSRRR